jgi:hypothetical protein
MAGLAAARPVGARELVHQKLDVLPRDRLAAGDVGDRPGSVRERFDHRARGGVQTRIAVDGVGERLQNLKQVADLACELLNVVCAGF